MSNYNAWFSSKGDVYYLQPEVDVTHHVSYSSFVSAFCRNEMKDRNYRSVQKHRALLNHETAKHRNSYFFQLFFLEHRNSQRNNFSWYWFCWEICGICKEGLQTWMSRCAIDSLDKQSGWKLSLSLVENIYSDEGKLFLLLHIERKAQKFDAYKGTNLRWCKIRDLQSSDQTTTTTTSTSFSTCTRCACPIAWGCHVNSFCRQNLVAVLTPTTRFSRKVVPRLRVRCRCKGELKGYSWKALIHCEMFRATCLAMFWHLVCLLNIPATDKML